MRKLLFSLLFFNAVFCFAQSAEGRYSSRMTRDGVIYFIMPKSIKDLSGIKKFEYDITLLNWSDTATVNFTFESVSMIIPDDIYLKSGNHDYKSLESSSLFIDIKKNHYEIRISSRFLVQDIEKAFNTTISPVFTFRQEEIEKRAAYKPGAWKKERKKLSDIFKLYRYSK
jgi:hypothetical protein